MRFVYRPNGASTYQPRARQRELCDRAVALGYRANWLFSPEGAIQNLADLTVCFALFRATKFIGSQTQGGASLCPGLIYCAPLGRKNGVPYGVENLCKTIGLAAQKLDLFQRERSLKNPELKCPE
jgi:hypothetical protein